MTWDPNVSRRQFLAATASLTAAATWGGHALYAADAEPEKVAFFLVGDTHYFSDADAHDKLNAQSAAVTSRLIDTLNTLPGEALPAEAGGGKVATPRGVIHAGDLIDSGDKNGPQWIKRSQTEWDGYVADFGLTGKDGRLEYPVYEVHGNHDGPQGKGVAIDGIIARNRHRPGLTNVSPNGLHYAWDWGPVHFLNLGIVVGELAEVKQRRRYAPLESLDFLVNDLKQLADSGRPVVITHHIDIARYTGPCSADDPANLHKEWNPCDVRGFYQALRDVNVVAINYGHTHARNVLTWDGESARAEVGLNLFNVDNSSHFHSEKQAFFYFEITSEELIVRECGTKDAWQSHFWTPQVWKRSVRAAAS